MSHLCILYQTQFQSYRNVVVAHILTGNGQRNGTVVSYIIGSYVVVESDLRTVLLVWIALSSHCLTVPSIVARGCKGHVLNPYLSVVGWIIVLVVTSMDIALNNLKLHQRLLGVVSVMRRIKISFNFTDYCPRLPSFTMLQIFLT